MKKLFIIPTAILFSFCCTNKEIMKKEEENKVVTKTESPCPSDGVCTTEILKNKSLVIKTDEFGSTYTQIIDSETTSVIVYQYNRIVKGDLQDAGYREEIIFEISNSTSSLTLKDKDIQITKMLFGRFCFCRGQTGYYKVENGVLNLSQKEDEINLNLNFKINEVPQKIQTINVTIK